MSIKTVGKFEVKYMQILDEKGNCDEKLKPKLKPNEIKRIYESMVLARVYDERALKSLPQQAGAAIENFLLKITDLGLSTCWTGAFSDEQVKRILQIPEDIEDNKFVILVKVEDDESTCNQDSIEIKIERKDHYVIVKEITITPQLISLGDEMNIEVQIENLGSREEDAIVLIENSELGISQKSEEFEIEEFGEEDKERVDFIIKIPENATEKEYILTAKILYNDGDENSLDKTFGVVKRLDLSGLNKLGPINLETIFLNDKTPYNQGVVSEGIILSDDNGVIALGGDDGKKIISNVKVKPLSLRLIPWLIFGIIVLFILIIIVDLANKNNPTQ